MRGYSSRMLRHHAQLSSAREAFTAGAGLSIFPLNALKAFDNGDYLVQFSYGHVVLIVPKASFQLLAQFNDGFTATESMHEVSPFYAAAPALCD
jgi:hypothetical protein